MSELRERIKADKDFPRLVRAWAAFIAAHATGMGRFKGSGAKYVMTERGKVSYRFPGKDHAHEFRDRGRRAEQVAEVICRHLGLDIGVYRGVVMHEADKAVAVRRAC